MTVADEDTTGNLRAVHPFLGSRGFQLGNWAAFNRLENAITSIPRAREMFVRRIRTLADDYLGSSYFTDRIDQLVSQIQADVELDQQRWGKQAHFGSVDFTLEEATNRIKSEFMPRRFMPRRIKSTVAPLLIRSKAPPGWRTTTWRATCPPEM